MELTPEPQTAALLVNSIHRLLRTLGSSSGTSIGKHGATFSQVLCVKYKWN